MQWNVVAFACVVAGGLLHQTSAQADDLAAVELVKESGTSWSPVDGVEDPSTEKALPVARTSNLGGNLVIMRNTGEGVVSVSFTDALPGIKQVIDPGGSLVWSCMGDAIPPVSLEVHGTMPSQRTLNVTCGDVLVVGRKDPRLAKYEELDPSGERPSQVDRPNQVKVEDAKGIRGQRDDRNIEPSLLPNQSWEELE